MHNDTSIAGRVRWLRELAGLSMRALSELSGLDSSHIRLIESGERDDPRSGTLKQIAEATGVTLDWLIAGKGDAPVAADVLAAVARAKDHPLPVGSVFTASDFTVEPAAAAIPALDDVPAPRPLTVARDGFDQTAGG